MTRPSIFFSSHAVRRMFERCISREDAIEVPENGELIFEYKDDKPFPSCLKMSTINLRPLHLVASVDRETNIWHTITVYEPDPKIWNDDFKNRRDL